MEKQYDPSKIEDDIYKAWEDGGVFKAEVDSSKEPYTVVIPPPNVTGVLHMGHGLNNTIQDILVRYHRMKGFNALWLPGTDHAGIATQNVVERQLAKENLTRHDVGREKFIERVWDWKEENGSIIINQLRKLGASCDWSRERFTMDEGLSKSVVEVFAKLHEEGHIYKGEYITNWCPRCGTALADEEVEHADTDGSFTHVSYPLADGSGSIEIATTRPETLLGDTAVAVHPEDDRYKDMVGKMLILPLVGREIPVIADDYVDKEFGTGAVKITPAHDPNDFEMGKRHDLPVINIMDGEAKINENAPEKYQGMDRFDCRKAVVEDLKTSGNFIKQESHAHAVGECYRCSTVVEPLVSMQWFVDMKELAKPAIKAVVDGEITFYTERWKKVYLHWMNNIRDWCISRQIWWGHQIPAWYAISETGGIVENDTPYFVARDEAEAMEKAKAKFGETVELKQDQNVLDTWFSSWLWPFSTFDWPEESADLDYFYPTSVLVTDMGIIFFWVARMVMAGYHFIGKLPFKDVYIHGTVMDEQGRKMSKSLGNGINPLEVIKLHGADALRYTVIAITPQGQNTLLSMDKFQIGARLTTKVWNASRYILMSADSVEKLLPIEEVELETVDMWILSRLEKAAADVETNIKQYKLNDMATGITHFFRDDFCDWYIEFSKKRLYGKDETKKVEVLSILVHVLKESMKLFHPVMPFITEEIYKMIPGTEGFVAQAEYPVGKYANRDLTSETAVERLQAVISGIRTVRAEMRVPPEKKCEIVFVAEAEEIQQAIIEEEVYLLDLANLAKIEVSATAEKPAMSATGVGNGYEFFLKLEGIIDVEEEKARLTKELEKIETELKKVSGKLANKKFTDKAPASIVEKEQSKAEFYKDKISKIKDSLVVFG